MILIIDNYDSFTQNLVQCVGELGFIVRVVRNDEVALSDILHMRPTHIIISPGPGNPNDSGISMDIIKRFGDSVPILGVCLGHQSIGYLFGADIKCLPKPMHGKVSKIYHDGEDLFSGLPNPFLAARYHSLVIDRDSLSQDLTVTAYDSQGNIMACRHNQYHTLRGIQFHPESLWTEQGQEIMIKFLSVRD